MNRVSQSGSENGSGCSRCGEMIRTFPRAGEVETRYDVFELEARLRLSIFIRFEGVNGSTNGLSVLSLRGRLLGVTGSTEALIKPMQAG